MKSRLDSPGLDAGMSTGDCTVSAGNCTVSTEDCTGLQIAFQAYAYAHISRECEAWKKRLPGEETGLKMPIGVEKGKGKEEGEKKGMKEGEKKGMTLAEVLDWAAS
ncbi:hypothetical protein BDZ91DRAFT_799657 [Kalaharituber pfeilii]|nr:hypothetical protein BDZ91DRAFT_799657 [Kalaharituber pfeilii]